MKCALYASLFLLLTVIPFESRAQVNVQDINSSGGGSTNIEYLKSTNEGSQLVNDVNSSGSSKALRTPPYLLRENLPYENFNPNGDTWPYDSNNGDNFSYGSFFPNENMRDYGNYGPQGNWPPRDFRRPQFYRSRGNYGY